MHAIQVGKKATKLMTRRLDLFKGAGKAVKLMTPFCIQWLIDISVDAAWQRIKEKLILTNSEMVLPTTPEFLV
jgi:hypothetical protein